MGKIVIGMISGIALASVMFLIIAGSPDESPPVPSEPDGNQLGEINVSPLNSAEQEGTARTAGESEIPFDSNATRTPVSAPAPATLLPIPLPSEFDWWSSGRGHQRLEQELPDSWSAETEAQVIRFFIERPQITNQYGIPTVNCRANGCEVLFRSYSLEQSDFVSGLGGALRDSGYTDEPWAEQFPVPLMESHRGDGVSTLAWLLMKSQP